MYHVAGTGLTALILYLLSYFFYTQSYYSLQLHRKIWNILLAVSFIITALAGVFLALQITYKWNIPVIKSILKWHVEFGIGLAATGIVHFLWHFSYFTNMFGKKKRASPVTAEIPLISADVGTNLFITGFISSAVQLLFLKEIMNIAGGYELIAGTFLASWLIGSAAGSSAARKSPLSDIRKINLFFSISPAVSLFLLLFLSRIFLKPGETPSFLAGIVFTLLVLIPFCFISGFTFIKLISFAERSRSYIPGRSFSVETCGGIAAGIAVSVLGSGQINTYEALLLILIMGISYVMLTFYLKGNGHKLIFKTAVLAVSACVILFSPDRIFRELLLRGIKVTESLDTPYGNITKGIYAGEESIYYDHRLLAYNDDASEREEDIHYAMLQTSIPENVLIISGSIRSHLQEIIKYPVSKVVYVERDPELTRETLPDSLKSVTNLDIENDDALTFVRKTNEKFDAVIVMLPPPSSLSLNRYYTYEFFKAVKKKMGGSGVFACSPGINPDYFNREAVKYYSSVYNSLKAVFRNVVPVSGAKLYYIASDDTLSTSFCRLVSEKNIKNVYVGPDYLSDDLTAAKTEEVENLLDPAVKINKSGLPVACFYYQSFNITKNIPEKIPSIILLAILFALPFFTVRRKNMLMYFSALSLAGFEITLLLILQLALGNMYQITGLITGGVMAGLAAGSGTGLRLDGRPMQLKAGLLILIYIISGIAASFILSTGERGILVIAFLIICGFLPAMITGNIFRGLTLARSEYSDPSTVYSSDLAGSAMGFILFSGIAVPLLGINYSLGLFPLLVLAGLVLTTAGNKS
jgi:spermidine synthase